jgi:hypothetical protein
MFLEIIFNSPNFTFLALPHNLAYSHTLDLTRAANAGTPYVHKSEAFHHPKATHYNYT